MTPTRCPDCEAAVPPQAAWCGQCWRELSPAPADTPPERATGERPGGDGPEPSGNPGWPCRCGERVSLSADVCPTCGTGFLAGATTDDPEQPAVVRRWAALPASRRFAAAGLVGIVVFGAILLGATLLGAVLT